jgi:uncharacterized protein YyaL (SSP411 family)
MLYDNALLSWTYFDAYQLTGEEFYLRIGGEVLDYVLRDMADPAGGFHSAEDADSEGEEGKFYVWTREEILGVLGSEDGELFCDYFGVSEKGNFEHGTSILHVRVKSDLITKRYGLKEEELSQKLVKCREKLLDVRSGRIRPSKDDKVLTDWNGLMLSSFAKGYQLTGDQRYLQAADRCGEFLREKMYSSKGLQRSYRDGHVSLHGFLSDYAFACNGLIDLYQAGFEIDHLIFADKLAAEMLGKFADEQGGLFQTLADQSDLLVRQKESHDGAIPSGNSVAAQALSRLALLTGKDEYRVAAEKIFAAFAREVEGNPRGFHNLINAYDFASGKPDEIAFVGELGSDDLEVLLAEVHNHFHPNKVLAALSPGSKSSSKVQKMIPLLRERGLVDNRATAYVCHNFACRLPVTDPTALQAQLQ